MDTSIEVSCQIDSNPRSVLGTPYTHAVCTVPRNAFINEAFGRLHQATGGRHAFGGIGKLATCKEETREVRSGCMPELDMDTHKVLDLLTFGNLRIHEPLDNVP